MSHGVEGYNPFGRNLLCFDFVSRLRKLCSRYGVRVFAWALMPSHFHLLLETGSAPLHVFMHHLLTGFCSFSNQVLKRRGHVFMGRFKSVLVEKDEYFLELVRYIHLNPVKKREDVDLFDPGSFRWTGHPALLGTQQCAWQDVDRVLSLFSHDRDEAIRNYVDFMKTSPGRTDEKAFEEGVYSIGSRGVIPIGEASSDQRRYDSTGPVLGSREFAARIASELHGIRLGGARLRGREHAAIEAVLSAISSDIGIDRRFLDDRVRSGASTGDRRFLCSILEGCGVARADIARLLGITRQGVSWMLRGTVTSDHSTPPERQDAYIRLFRKVIEEEQSPGS